MAGRTATLAVGLTCERSSEGDPFLRFVREASGERGKREEQRVGEDGEEGVKERARLEAVR